MTPKLGALVWVEAEYCGGGVYGIGVEGGVSPPLRLREAELIPHDRIDALEAENHALQARLAAAEAVVEVIWTMDASKVRWKSGGWLVEADVMTDLALALAALDALTP